MIRLLDQEHKNLYTLPRIIGAPEFLRKRDANFRAKGKRLLLHKSRNAVHVQRIAKLYYTCVHSNEELERGTFLTFARMG